MSRRTLGAIVHKSGDPIPTPSRTLGSINPSLAVVTKEFIVYMTAKDNADFPYTTAIGDFGVQVTGTNEVVGFEFYVPHDFTTLVDAVVMVIPDATETIQWDVTTNFGADGEAYNANSDSITDATLGVTNNQIAECSVADALTSIAANDYVGVIFGSDTASINVTMLRIRYS